MRRALVAALLGALVLVLPGAPAGAASAASSESLSLSSDGTHFAPRLDGSLFAHLASMVPGDEQTGTFWVRNETDQSAYLRIGVGSVTTTSSEFIDAMSIRTDTDAIRGRTTTLTAAGVCTALTTPRRLASGGTARIDVTLSLAAAADAATQRARVELSMVASLSDSSSESALGSDICTERSEVVVPSEPGSTSSAQPSTAADPSSSPPSPSPSIPATAAVSGNTAALGQQFAVLALVLASALGAGAFLITSRRRARPDDSTKEG